MFKERYSYIAPLASSLAGAVLLLAIIAFKERGDVFVSAIWVVIGLCVVGGVVAILNMVAQRHSTDRASDHETAHEGGGTR